MSTISVLVGDSAPAPAGENEFRSRSLGSGPAKSSGVAEVDTGKLQQALQKLTGQMSGMLTDIKAVGRFRLKQVTISVEVSGEGQLFLVAKAGAKGGITLTFEGSDEA